MFVPPPINPDDIQWASEALGLPPTAFTGAYGADPRAGVLLSNASLDIEACPGSGKTTLLVAKLAILARTWRSRRSGICVLSHTNAARREVERCLGRTREGTRLLSYPHFVGTIHGFVNELLAIPWLRSLGYPIRAIDDGLCEQHRRRLLSLNRFQALRNHVGFKEQNPDVNFVGSWHVASPEFLVLKENGEHLFANANSQSARQLVGLAKQCVEDGFYKYGELFMWANDLLDKHPEAAASIRQRFPILFIDEVQDNSESQSRLLQRIFVEGPNPVIRQRFGDSNQAIYGHTQAAGARSDPFPVEAIRRDIPNSHRFGQQIANFANPLALRPQGIQGLGPSTQSIQSETAFQHAVLLFNDDSIGSVLRCFASYLRQLFSDEELRVGTFTAIGAVHRPGEDNNAPRFVGHYWPEYDHQLNYSEPKPGTLNQYVAAGWCKAGERGDVHAVVEQIAEGILRAVQIARPDARVVHRKRKNRFILESLRSESEVAASYRSLVVRIVGDERQIAANEWQEIWRPIVMQVITTIAGAEPDQHRLDSFLAWPDGGPGLEVPHTLRGRDNFFRDINNDSIPKIRVGSIHSVKGETHTATLVLDTFFHEHHLHALKPWLFGERVGGENEGVRLRARLKQHYVAMTRPTHLLCVAMRDQLSPENVDVLKARAWRVGRVQVGGGIEWL